jgi:hypothetical protein
MRLLLPPSDIFDKAHPIRMRPSLPASDLQFDWIDRKHPDRESIQGFIADVFRARFGAELQHFSDLLMGSRDANGHWNAAVGLSSLANGKAFLEQYLEHPVEQEIALHQSRGQPLQPVNRADIVEFGNLAATRPGASRALILRLAPFLRARRIRWIVFTGTRSLANSFAKFDYKPAAIAPADPRKLNGAEALWGSYYASSPNVMYGDVEAAYARFCHAPY